MRRGQVEMRDTLEKINAIQMNIVQFLLQITHAGKGPEIYAKREGSGSHGGTRPHQENSPHYHTEGQSYVCGAPQGTTHSRATPRPYLPTFLDNHPQCNYEDEIEDKFEQYAREYHTLSAGFQRQVMLD
jgi:hypothetical protein